MMGRTDTTVLPTLPGRLGSGLVNNVFKSLVELFHLFSFEQRGTGTPSSVFRQKRLAESHVRKRGATLFHYNSALRGMSVQSSEACTSGELIASLAASLCVLFSMIYDSIISSFSL